MAETAFAQPTVPEMLRLLRHAYTTLIAAHHPTMTDAQRLLTVADDLHWYAERLGAARVAMPPKAQRWSFAENLWHVTEQAMQESPITPAHSIIYFIDHGKEHVGQAAEIFALFEYSS